MAGAGKNGFQIRSLQLPLLENPLSWHIAAMAITLAIKRMSRADKLRAMEALWADLSQDETRMGSPDWHAEALRET